MNNLREQVAALSHDQWSGWMEYLFSKTWEDGEDGEYGYIIPYDAYDRWTKQMKTEYENLSEEEKNSDRTEADKFLQLLKENSGQISDGYHTFDELYEHRIVLFIKLCQYVDEDMIHYVWRSKTHSDGTSIDGWFLLGINQNKGCQISYHIPMKYWKDTEFASTLEKAREWDGHTSDDVIKRLLELQC